MPKTIILTYHGMRGEGITVKAAKLDAGRKIEELVTGDLTPYLLSSGNWIALVTKTNSDYGGSWGHRLLNKDALASGPLFATTMSGSQKIAVKEAAKHLAQTVGNYTGLEQYLDPVDMRNLDEYFQLLAAHPEAKSKGMNHQACHTEPCNHS